MTLFVKPKYGKIIVPLRREFKTNIMISYKHFTPLAYAASPFGGDAQRWGTYPQVMFTFFKKHGGDLKGTAAVEREKSELAQTSERKQARPKVKTVIPFTTHEGSGIANCVEDVKAAFAGANVTKGFSIYGHEVRTQKAKVEKWLKGL